MAVRGSSSCGSRGSPWLSVKGLDMVTRARNVPCYHFSVWLLLQSFATLSLFCYLRWKWLFNPDSLCPLLESNASSEQPRLIILVWTFPFQIVFPLNECSLRFGIPGCFYTTDRNFYKSADAVILHHADIMDGKLPQEPRPPNQRWIWFTLEPPSKFGNLQKLDKLINVTMTYRRDSDIFTPYGGVLLSRQPHKFTIPRKSKLVAWATTNWNPKMRRVHYYKELKKHLHVDIFGKSNRPLGKDEHASVLSQYKFYLAFENSESQDYITEKLWYNALVSGAVPVVLGPTRENYERFLPPEAFIHVDDFSSAKELAEYLLMLDKDGNRYQMYFQWRSHYEVEGVISWPTHYCKTCDFLKQPQTYRTIPSLVDWFT